MEVLVTGGAGYIGSVTATALEQRGHVPIILDSLLSGPRAFVGDRVFYQGDIADRHLVAQIVKEHPDLACTIHMAARLAVPESVQQPYLYYRDNVAKSLELFDQLVESGKPDIVFSSSASVYAPSEDFEVTEESPVAPASPYARTKRVMETALEDLAGATALRALILRYFNPIGAAVGLTSGVYAKEPTHVLGQLMMAALGQKEYFTLTGTNLPTPDGTGVRDYIHVWDLARAHVAAVERFDEALAGSCCDVVNLGTGRPVTVRGLIAAVESVIGREVPVKETDARPGDAIGAYANVAKAARRLGWSTELGVTEGIESALAWAEKRHEVLGYR